MHFYLKGGMLGLKRGDVERNVRKVAAKRGFRQEAPDRSGEKGTPSLGDRPRFRGGE